MSVVLFIIIILLWFSLYSYIPFQVTYLKSINVASSFIGLIIGLYGAAQMLLRFPFGIITDSIGGCKAFIVFGASFSTLGAVIKLSFPDANGFLIGGIFSGMGASTWMMYMVLYSYLLGNGREHEAASKSLVASVSGMFLAFLSATIFYEKFGMKFLLIEGTFAGGLAVVLSLFLKEEKICKRASIKNLIMVVKNKRLIFFSLLATVQQGIQMAAAVSFTLNRVRELGGASFTVGIASLLHMISAIISSYFASTSFANRKGAKFYIPSFFILLAFYCIIVVSTRNVMVAVSSQIISGFSTGILSAYLTSEAVKDVEKERKSSAMGFFQATYAFGIFIYPIITGKLVDSYSIEIAYAALALISLISSFLAFTYYKNS